MVSFAEGLRAGLKSAYCSQVANSPQWFGNLRSVLVSGDLRERADNLYRWVCDVPPDEPSGVVPPFTGGQCPVKYIVTYTLDADGPSPSQGTLLAIGPIRGLREVQASPTSTQVFLQANSGVVFSGQCFNILNPSGPTDTFLGSYNPATGGTSRIDSVSACTGDDDCGDPDVVTPPPAPITEDVDITYEGDDNTEYNLTVPVIFAPFYVALDGTLRIPINIGELNFNGELSFEPTFEVNPDFGTPDGGDPSVDNPELPGTGSPGLDEPVPVDKPEATIIGVHVRATADAETRATEIFQAAAPDILAPRCANVVFAIATGSLRGWTPDIAVKSVTSYIPCPVSFGAVDVRVTAEPGFTVEFTPVRGKPLNAFEP